MLEILSAIFTLHHGILSNKSDNFVNICGAASTIAWSIRLALEGKDDTSKYHWLILKCISYADKVIKRMGKNWPQLNYRIWSRQGKLVTYSE